MPKNSRLSYNLGAKSREFVTIPQTVAIADKGKDKFGAFLKGVTDNFPYPEDFYADARWNKSSRPWKILVTVDNFKTIKVGKPADKPKNLRAKGRQRDARMVDVGNYKLWFVNLGTSYDPSQQKAQTAQQERGSAWILRRVLRDNYRYKDAMDIYNDPLVYQLYDVYPNVSPDWIQSYYLQNERMLQEFSGSKWNEFNRDGGFMGFITQILNEKFGISQKDTWNPADIWMISGSQIKIEKEISDQLKGAKGTQTIHELNSIMRSLFNNRRVVGVSLKKAEGNKAYWKEYNLKELTLSEKNDYNYKIDRIKLALNFKQIAGKDCFQTQDTTVFLDAGKNKWKFQIKDLGGKPPGGNLKFEGTDPNAPKARGGKSPEVFTEQLFKDNNLTFRNQWQRYPQDLATFQKHKELWRKTFQDVNMNPLVDTGTEADQFIINIESQYALPNYRGSKSDGEKGLAQGPWIARSKLMQLDFVYAFLHQINTKAKREEFWTDMAFLAMKMGGSKGSFGPFGKLY